MSDDHTNCYWEQSQFHRRAYQKTAALHSLAAFYARKEKDGAPNEGAESG